MYIRMPAAHIEKAQQYRCSAFALPSRQLSITRFTALPSSIDRVHHMTLYLCPRPPVHSEHPAKPLTNGEIVMCADMPWREQGCKFFAGYEHMDPKSEGPQPF